MHWIAHKFGGTSLKDAECIGHVVDLLERREDAAQVVVVSAMAGVTDELIALTGLAATGDTEWAKRLARLRTRHLDALEALVGSADGENRERLVARFDQLQQLLSGLALMGTAPVEVVELVSGLGEVFCAELVTARFNLGSDTTAMIDARDVLRVQPTPLMVGVDWADSEHLLTEFQIRNPCNRYVVTGFVCRLRDGRISTLGRNGSDHSGSIFARLFGASELHIWTNVDGLLSADPAAVPQAVLLDHLSYREAFELAYFGARVLHPQALAPALDAGIPVRVRNTFRPNNPGTLIDAEGSQSTPVKGITSIGDMALITIEGAGMIGVPGTAERVFSALHRAEVSVAMISQSSSEHSICLVLPTSSSEQAVSIIEAAFAQELRHGQIQRVVAADDIRILAIVGEGMTGTPGVAAGLFNSLSRAGVNVRAIAQGASERNISVAVDEADADRALKAVHAGFYLSEHTLSIGLVGPGQVGRELLRQIARTREGLLERARLDLRVRAVAGSKRMRLAGDEEARLDAAALADAPFDEDSGPLDFEHFTQKVNDDHWPHALIIDCTASDEVAGRYVDWLAAGIHVVTPNKRAGSGPIERYRAVRAPVEAGIARWRYEATVGAGLPIIQTLRDLIDTGDTIRRIEGIFSGTLAYLFNRFAPGMSFAELVGEAHAAGYTEPDPRDDLSGMDVARKLVIVAREMGLDLELTDVEVENLIPDPLAELGVDDFLARLDGMDAGMTERLQAARSEGCVLRHVAELDRHGRAAVSLRALPEDHPFAHLALTDNVVAFTTDRYCDNPLIVQGPGAGPEVTAAGVFADLLRVASALGAKL
jgi:aspartokinase/homoserine dehydrogenase 1